MNIVYERSKTTVTPEVGMGATIICFSDRQAATVVEVKTPSKITIQTDKAIRTDKNGMSESQQYNYSPDPDGHKYVVTLRQNGQWRMSKSNTAVMIGFRDHYYDFSF